MSLSSLERNKYGPTWFEVLFVAWLGLLFGVVLACLFLILKPVPSGAQISKDLPPEALTYVEGSTDAQRGSSWMRKRQALMEGQSVELTEEELNCALVPAQAKKPSPKKDDKSKQAAVDEPFLVPGVLNFRLANSLLQIGLPVRIPLLDLNVFIQVRGDFSKTPEGVVFVPKETYVGSLPLHLIPYAQAEFYKRLSSAQSKPADIESVWGRLRFASIEGKRLRLDMPPAP